MNSTKTASQRPNPEGANDHGHDGVHVSLPVITSR
jgi:hypothetical protein